jgi:multidrug efflux pump subunit AcrB
MNYLASFFLKNYKFTFILSLFVVLYGVMGTLGVNSETFPSVNLGVVVVSTRYDGATAEDIETKITKPIEEEIQKVSGLKQVKSTSQAGLSTIVTEVDIDKYSVEKVISDLQRAVDRTVGLPADLIAKPLFLEIKSDEFPVIEVAVVGENTNRIRDEVADALQENIRDNKKVSSVSLTGFSKRQFNIYLDVESLVRNHVSITEVSLALTQRNLTIPAGVLKSDDKQKLVRIEGKSVSKAELESIVVRSNFSGQRILLKDVARVEDSAEEPRTLSSYEGKPATLITIAKKGGADIIDLAHEIKSTLDVYSDKYKGKLEFHIFSNEGTRVADRLGVLVSNGWQGIVLVIVFLLIFLRGKVGLVSALSLPLVLAATLGVISSLGYSLNTITIIALVIAIGMLVDNAVVVAENYTRLRDEGLDVDEALLKTVRDLWAPVAASVLTTVAAFLPMLVTTGVMGQFIKAIPIVVTIALLLTLVESFFLLPMRLKLVGYDPKLNIGKKDYFDRVLVPKFERQIEWLVDNKKKSVGIFFGIISGTFLLLVFGNKLNLFPTDQAEIYIVRLETAKGTPVEKTLAVLEAVQDQIKEKLGDKSLHIVGTAGESATDLSDPKGVSGSNTGMIRVLVSKETQDNVPTNTILALLREVKHPGLTQYSAEALANGPPVGDPVTVTFRSNDSDQLAAAANHIQKFISNKDGIFDAKVDDVIGDDEVTVDVRYENAAQLGLSLQDIGFSVRTAIAGSPLGDVNLNNRKVDYFLRFEDKDKKSVSNLENVLISDRQGNLIPLKNVASFEVRSGSTQIKRFDFKRAKTVTANLDDTKITSIQANQAIKDEFQKISQQFKDVDIVFGGEAEKTNESMRSLFVALILSIIGIFALMVLIFRSYLSPLIILTTIPFGLVGVALAFFLHQKDLSFMALIGVIGLGGIIVNSGIILISFIEQMREETKLSLRDILIRASAMRLRAVLVTSLTTISGLVPTAYGIGGVDYFIIPMALALAWGLSTGTLLTLYWVPPAYALVDSLLGRWRAFRGV